MREASKVPFELKFINESEVPLGPRNDWKAIYDRIPLGKALVISEDEANFNTVASSLGNYHREGNSCIW